MPPEARFAVYWVPAREHPLWRAGCEWLGRDAESAEPGAAPAFARAPWRYGFHATLCAPMRLADGISTEHLHDTLVTLARRTADFEMPALAVAPLADFLALRPRLAPEAPQPLRRLADDCVRGLDRLRAPLDEATRQRRAGGLDAVGLSLLDRWGYPHVFERWRLHLTLSDSGRQADAALRALAQRHFAPALAAPLRAHAIALFVEPSPGAPLRLQQRFTLG